MENINRKSFTENIAAYLPQEALEVLNLASGFAFKHSEELYLAGGVVRDIILGNKTSDFDVLIKGDGVRLAKHLSEVLGADLLTHERFQTAKIEYKGYSFDITSSRSETYSKAGALPAVTPSSDLKEDMKRRDFTINAMAISLNNADYGELIDYYGGLQDLEQKLVRTLHGKSFSDDATRMWRAIRYEQRLGFTIEAETFKQLKNSLEMLKTISGPRIRYELECVFTEKRPFPVLKRAEELGVLASVHPNLKTDESLESILSKISEEGGSKEEAARAYFAILAHNLSEDEICEMSTRLNFDKKTAALIKSTANLTHLEVSLSRKSIAASSIYGLLKDTEPRALNLAQTIYTNETAKKNIKWYAKDLRHVKTKLGGAEVKELLKAKGTEISGALEALLSAKLDGKARTEEDEKAFILAMRKTL